VLGRNDGLGEVSGKLGHRGIDIGVIHLCSPSPSSYRSSTP
jgi:hypothetical protein